MSHFRRSGSSLLTVLIALVVTTIAVYLLRGFGILTFIPGGVILILIALSLITGIIYGIQKTKRF